MGESILGWIRIDLGPIELSDFESLSPGGRLAGIWPAGRLDLITHKSVCARDNAWTVLSVSREGLCL